MEIKTNKMDREKVIVIMVSLLLLALIVVFTTPLGMAPNIIGPNYKNVTVWTHANITNSKPEVLNVTIYEAMNSSNRNITVISGYTRTVFCNASVRDWNGFGDIVYVNASLWHRSTSTYDSADDNNTHYTNFSCTTNASSGAYTGWYVCSFDVLYYSNNGTWWCNVTVMDTVNKTGWNNGTVNFLPVYALNVTDGIDYGDVAVEDYTAPDKSANVTNLGNMAINVTVQGYGARLGDGLAMNCSLNGNISVANERFALVDGVAYGSKTALANTPVLMPGLTMPKQTVPGNYIVNNTFWQLYVPPNPAGNCTGYIVFTATAP
jgi:hypothetical protein